MGINDVEVKTHSGYTYGESPLSFNWAGVEFVVSKVENSWLEPGKKYFLVRTTKNKLFELCYNQAADQWTATEHARS